MTLCTPPCLHQDYCIHFGCPFKREPQSAIASSSRGGVENRRNAGVRHQAAWRGLGQPGTHSPDAKVSPAGVATGPREFPDQFTRFGCPFKREPQSAIASSSRGGVENRRNAGVRHQAAWRGLGQPGTHSPDAKVSPAGVATGPREFPDQFTRFGCPFKREPQSKESHSNQGGACLENAKHDHCFDLTQRRRQTHPQPRSEGSPAHDLEVRIGAAGKGPRVKMRAKQARPSRSGCSADLIQSSGVGPGNHQPRSITWGGRNATPAPSGRARDRAICPAGSRNSFQSTANVLGVDSGKGSHTAAEKSERDYLNDAHAAGSAPHLFNSNGGRTRLRPVERATLLSSRGGKRAVQSIRISRGMDKAPDQRPSRGGIKRLAAQLWWLRDMRWQWPGPREANSRLFSSRDCPSQDRMLQPDCLCRPQMRREATLLCQARGEPDSRDSNSQFGCVNTGPNLHRSTKSGPQSGDWIPCSGVTTAQIFNFAKAFLMSAYERLSNLQIVILRTLLKRGADKQPITLRSWMRRSTIHLWRSGLIEIWYRQSRDHGSRGPFYTLTLVGARLAHEFLYPAPRGISGAEKVQ